MLHRLVQQNSNVSPKYLRPNQYDLKIIVTDSQGQKNRFSGFKFYAQFYLGTYNHFENKLFLQLSATITTNNNIFLYLFTSSHKSLRLHVHMMDRL